MRTDVDGTLVVSAVNVSAPPVQSVIDILPRLHHVAVDVSVGLLPRRQAFLICVASSSGLFAEVIAEPEVLRRAC